MKKRTLYCCGDRVRFEGGRGTVHEIFPGGFCIIRRDDGTLIALPDEELHLIERGAPSATRAVE